MPKVAKFESANITLPANMVSHNAVVTTLGPCVSIEAIMAPYQCISAHILDVQLDKVPRVKAAVCETDSAYHNSSTEFWFVKISRARLFTSS